ncbi:MAG: hypothetical protein ABTQ34_08325 [Bdellovibrionales bacterium]
MFVFAPPTQGLEGNPFLILPYTLTHCLITKLILAKSVIPAKAGNQLASGSERNRTDLRPTIVSAIESLSRRRRGAAGFRLAHT